MKKETKPTENLPDKFAEFDRSFRHVANTQAAEFHDAETRGRVIMANTPTEAAQTQPVPVQGFVKDMQDATARGREQMAASRKGERSFPPARIVVQK